MSITDGPWGPRHVQDTSQISVSTLSFFPHPTCAVWCPAALRREITPASRSETECLQARTCRCSVRWKSSGLEPTCRNHGLLLCRHVWVLALCEGRWTRRVNWRHGRESRRSRRCICVRRGLAGISTLVGDKVGLSCFLWGGIVER